MKLTYATIYKIATYAFVILSMLMTYSIIYFHINDYIASPQFTDFQYFDEILKQIKAKGKRGFYTIFFIADFIWAPCFLILLHGFSNRFRRSKWTFFIIVAVAAYIFDVIENLTYLEVLTTNFFKTILPTVVSIKIALYALAIICSLKYFYQKFILGYARVFANLFIASFLSILIIGFVLILLTRLNQGATILIHIFEHPLHILLVFFLLNFLAIIISHFPIYFYLFLNRSESAQVEWCMEEGRIPGLGIVYYKPKYQEVEDFEFDFKDRQLTIEQKEKIKAYEINKKNTSNIYNNFIRRSLGIILLICWLYALLFLYESYYNPNYPISTITVVISFLFLYYYYSLESEKTKWKETIKTKFDDIEFYNLLKSKITKFHFYGILTLLGLLISIGVIHFYQWHIVSLTVVILTTILNIFFYIQFRISRSFLPYFYKIQSKYFRFKADLASNPDQINCKGDQLPLYISFYDFGATHKKVFPYFIPFGNLAHNVQYLRVMQFAGYISLLFVIGFSRFSFSAVWLNPLVILFAFLILYYSIPILLIKHWIYYRSEDSTESKYRSSFNKWLPVIVCGFMGLILYSTSIGNELHVLPEVDEAQNKIVHIEQFVDSLNVVSLNDTTFQRPKYYTVSSFGGGLKANYWTLLLLHELRNLDHEIFQKTISFSGVSGGGVGLANFTALQASDISYENQAQAIDEIGVSNALSFEALLFFGLELLREWNPFSKPPDRALQSMKIHGNAMGYDFVSDQDLSYRNFWYKAYQKNKRFPALLVNSTSTSKFYGIAPSVVCTSISGAMNVLDGHAPKSLRFYDVVSTTNRFPLLSPAARIRNRGHFLDGGYFENSGFLTTLSFYKQLQLQGLQKHDIHHIIISNSKSQYIEELLQEFYKERSNFMQNEVSTGEVSAIFKTISDIEKLPSYLIESQQLYGEGDLTIITMPQIVSYADIKNYIKGDPQTPLALMNYLESKNNAIVKALEDANDFYKLDQWGIVEPPLARLLSYPGAMYEKAMVKYHPDLRNTLRYIIEH